ncbi:tetratricopeptide repeat protein [Micromonospora sp. KC606]|uniref:tetratricopeptide repeat protein n=1 Tax=Micromonospora sp. KC606 TaxID=2530379 RepID=UPI00104D2026|nr:tetratricopeptide repeat protein [Micromonospora sp. KC606]TDC70861.1 tetratricopeptide repeat protein [Micromonospora sp. KC606]
MTAISGPPGDAVQHVTATAGFAYGAIGADVHVHGDGTPLYLLHEERPGPRWDDDALRQLPSRMLDVHARVVPFTGRGRERDALRRWRDGEARLGVRLLHGAGGQGKTRLAARFAAESRTAGWRVVLASVNIGGVAPRPDSQDLRLDEHRGVLLVVDYADRWPLTALIWLLRNSLLHRPDRPGRVLLLARSDAGWPAVRAELGKAHVQVDVSAQALPPITTGIAGERSRMFAAARDAFAAVHGIDDPSLIAAPIDLDHEDLGLTLALHVAALVAVDAHATGAPAPNEPGQLTRYLLDREEAHWTHLYEQRTRGLDHHTPPSVMARTTLTAVLAGPLSYPAAVTLLDRVERELPADRIISDHGRCYPGTEPAAEPTVLQPLYPDRLAEDYLAHRLSDRHARPWASARLRQVLRSPESPTEAASVARAMLFLVATADRWPRIATEQLHPLLRERPWLAVIAGNATLSMLAASPTIGLAVLEAIEAEFPAVPYVDLDLGAADVAERTAHERLRRADNDSDRASVHAVLGGRLANAGRYDAAVEALEKATATYRALAAGDSAEFVGLLAACLDMLGVARAGQGRRDRSVTVGTEALQRYRQLFETEPDRYRFPTAQCLNNLSNWLADQDRGEEALTTAREAVELLRPLATADPRRYEPFLATTLDTVANRLLEAGRLDEVLAVTQEALTLHNRGVTTNPGAHLPQYARAVGNLGARLLAAGRRDEAPAPIREAVRLLRELDRDNPLTHRSELANALLNLAAAESGPPAREAATEGVRLYRALAGDNPSAHRGGLVLALARWGDVSEQSGDQEAAIDAYAESLRWYREAPDALAAMHRPRIALLPARLGRLLVESGRTAEATVVLTESATVAQRLLDRLPLAPSRAILLMQRSMALMAEGSLDEAQRLLGQVIDLARDVVAGEATGPFADIVELRAVLLGRSGDHVGAAAVARELVQLRRECPGDDPGTRTAELLRAVELLAEASALSGRYDEALEPTREAVLLSRPLAGTDPTRLPQLARSLDRFVAVRRRCRTEAAEAFDAAQESVQLWRRAADQDPTEHLSELATALHVLGQCLHGAGRQEEAVAATAECLRLWRRLARSDPGANAGMVGVVAHGLSRRLMELGRDEEALAAITESVAVLEPLAGTAPDDHLADYATSLWNRCVLLRKLKRTDEVTAALKVALPVHRRLADKDPGAHLADLAVCLHDLGVCLRRQGRLGEAVSPAEEAVTIRRRLAGTAAEHLPDLATSLHNLGNLWADLGRGHDAPGPVEEAVAIRRRLAEADPGAHLGALASALDDLGVLQSDLGQQGKALAPATQAATIRRRLAAAEPEVYLPDLAITSHNLGLLLADLGQGKQALTAAAEAVTIRRRLAGGDRGTYLPPLARSLSAYARVCLLTGRNLPGAVRAARESVELHTTLAQRDPQRFGAAFLQACHLLADALDRCGEPAEAAVMRRHLDTRRAGGTAR